MSTNPTTLFALRLRLTSLLVLLTLSGMVRAQQEPAFAMYMWNMLAVNPAYAGSNDRLNTNLVGRQQWVGMPGSPSTQALSLHCPVANEKMGLGTSVVRDNIGALNDLRAAVDLAYRIRTGPRMRLAFGLKAGLEWMQLNLSAVPNVDPRDPAFIQDMRSGARPIIGFGTHWWSEKGFLAFHMPRMMEYDALETNGDQPLMRVRRQRAFMLTAGRVFEITNDLKLQTWSMLKTNLHTPAALDVTLSLVVRDQLWIGVSRHGTGTVAGLLAYRFAEKLQLAYAYGASTGVLRGWNDGTHEIMLGYDVPLRTDRTLSPRYF